jgi:hypothetical protein
MVQSAFLELDFLVGGVPPCFATKWLEVAGNKENGCCSECKNEQKSMACFFGAWLLGEV